MLSGDVWRFYSDLAEETVKEATPRVTQSHGAAGPEVHRSPHLSDLHVLGVTPRSQWGVGSGPEHFEPASR